MYALYVRSFECTILQSTCAIQMDFRTERKDVLVGSVLRIVSDDIT